uniref:Uncharacterized protein n=1 Tax=Anguilla anguilla TaxID=7936 RepID=A0A0E9R176_ANGAN
MCVPINIKSLSFGQKGGLEF